MTTNSAKEITLRVRQFFGLAATGTIIAIMTEYAQAPVVFLWLWVLSVGSVLLIALLHEHEDSLARHIDVQSASRYVIPVIWIMIALAPFTLLLLTVQFVYWIAKLVWLKIVVRSVQWMNSRLVD